VGFSVLKNHEFYQIFEIRINSLSGRVLPVMNALHIYKYMLYSKRWRSGRIAIFCEC